MKFIELNTINKDRVYVNVEAITAIKSNTNRYSTIITSNNDSYTVEESFDVLYRRLNVISGN